MGCFSGGQKGGGVMQVEKLTPEQQRLVSLLAKKAEPAISAITGATIPGMEFAPGGPSRLQQQAFGAAGQLPNQMAFDPSQIMSAMAPVGKFGLDMFTQGIVPTVMSALGEEGMARSSGVPEILGRHGRNLVSQLAAEFAPMQYQGLQQSLNRQMQVPGMMAGLGGAQRGIGEEQNQFGLQRFMGGAREADPRLGFIGPAFTSAYDTAVQQGSYSPGLGSQLLGFGGSLLGGIGAGGGTLKGFFS